MSKHLKSLKEKKMESIKIYRRQAVLAVLIVVVSLFFPYPVELANFFELELSSKGKGFVFLVSTAMLMLIKLVSAIILTTLMLQKKTVEFRDISKLIKIGRDGAIRFIPVFLLTWVAELSITSSSILSLTTFTDDLSIRSILSIGILCGAAFVYVKIFQIASVLKCAAFEKEKKLTFFLKSSLKMDLSILLSSSIGSGILLLITSLSMCSNQDMSVTEDGLSPQFCFGISNLFSEVLVVLLMSFVPAIEVSIFRKSEKKRVL